MNFGKRFFAWMLKQGDSFNHNLYREYKTRLFHDISGLVVEIGPGTGVNFSYMPPGVQWIGIEPNQWFHALLLDQARARGIEARLLAGYASHIELPDNSADFVVCTLVLCSVGDMDKAIAEMRRVLKPGGKLVFIEHVAAPANTTLRRIQKMFNPLNRLVADGCNCNRETWKSLEQGGFTSIELKHDTLRGAIKIHSPHILGMATK